MTKFNFPKFEVRGVKTSNDVVKGAYGVFVDGELYKKFVSYELACLARNIFIDGIKWTQK